MNSDVIVKREGEVLSITLNRPDRGNAASDEMAVRLTEAVEQADPDIRAVVIRGAGEDFCVGRASPPRPKDAPAPEALQLRKAHDVVFRAYGAIRTSPVPVIALVQGRALGFGCAIAAVADITIAAADARFQVPEFAHNILPTMVMSSLIDRVPLKALMYQVYTTKEISAERALAIGIASEVVVSAELEAVLDQTLKSLLKAPRPALLAVKEYARGAQAIDIQKAVDYARSLHAVINTSSEMRRKD
jgi:enoyl-CoA hydratase